MERWFVVHLPTKKKTTKKRKKIENGEICFEYFLKSVDGSTGMIIKQRRHTPLCDHAAHKCEREGVET